VKLSHIRFNFVMRMICEKSDDWDFSILLNHSSCFPDRSMMSSPWLLRHDELVPFHFFEVIVSKG
jgi:hypothetical protein